MDGKPHPAGEDVGLPALLALDQVVVDEVGGPQDARLESVGTFFLLATKEVARKIAIHNLAVRKSTFVDEIVHLETAELR